MEFLGMLFVTLLVLGTIGGVVAAIIYNVAKATKQTKEKE